jgi:site-specific recombinase XerD
MAEHHLVDVLAKVARLANMKAQGRQILRHTFCSRLRCVAIPRQAIQELAGHRDLTTTQRYMRLSPDAIGDAIRLLERGSGASACGDIVETGEADSASN